MGISHESYLSDIESEFPEKVEEMKGFIEQVKPPVSEAYLESLCGDDEGMRELFEEMIDYFYRYTRDVCEQESLKQEDLQGNLERIKELDGPRTQLHNTMIESVKIFARNVKKRGGDPTWIEPIDKKGRAGYAQLALLITFTDIIEHHSHS